RPRAPDQSRADWIRASMSDSAALPDGVDLLDHVAVLVGIDLLRDVGASLPFRRGGIVRDAIHRALRFHLLYSLGIGGARFIPLALDNVVQAVDHGLALVGRQRVHPVAVHHAGIGGQ